VRVPFPYAGEVCAMLAPLCWAVAVILYRRSSELPALSMNLFKSGVAIALLLVTMALTGTGIPLDRSWADWARLVVSGVLGLAVADTLLFEGLRRVGAARVALVDTTYAPMMVGMSWLFLGETLRPAFLVGAVAVLIGVSLATLDLRAAFARGQGHVLVGMLYAFGAIVGTALGVMLSKPVLERSALVEVTFTRLVAGNVALLLFVAARGQWEELRLAYTPAPVWKNLLPASIVGTYLSLLFWLGGFKWGDASVAAVLNQLATVYILALARLVLDETLHRRQIAGAGLAALGALVIVLTR
jgi:drug/metabolite transporter (DMT)-like permease